jgi:SAM-dependent methyltransferase
MSSSSETAAARASSPGALPSPGPAGPLPPSGGGDAPGWDVERAYDRYYASGTYARRYPAPNARTLELLLALAGGARQILDFGCGNGRYAVPLLERTTARLVAYDLSPEALSQLAQRLGPLPGRERVSLLSGGVEVLAPHAPFDLIVAMFGVLSYVASRAERVRLLGSLGALLSPTAAARLVLSVPSRYRVLLPHQLLYALRRALSRPARLATEPGDVFYRRSMQGGGACDLYYHLYSPGEIRAELEEAGFVIERLGPESVIHESWTCRWPAVAGLDRLLAHFVPAGCAHGMLVVARRDKERMKDEG